MIRYITIGLITLLTGMLNSCYEDKGHYKYDWVQEIDLTDVLKDTTVGRGNVLHIPKMRRKLLIRMIILSNGRLLRGRKM